MPYAPASSLQLPLVERGSHSLPPSTPTPISNSELPFLTSHKKSVTSHGTNTHARHISETKTRNASDPGPNLSREQLQKNTKYHHRVEQTSTKGERLKICSNRDEASFEKIDLRHTLTSLCPHSKKNDDANPHYVVHRVKVNPPPIILLFKWDYRKAPREATYVSLASELESTASSTGF